MDVTTERPKNYLIGKREVLFRGGTSAIGLR
jgi:hypothetical protein